MTASIAVLAFVTCQRLGELWLSKRNTDRLLKKGAVEYAPAHYPLIVTVHVLWLVTLWWLAPGRAVDLRFLALFGIAQIGRLWVLRTLGPRWTTRIIMVPGELLVARGPYRLVNHPNYLVVAAEIALLPLAFGLWWVAILFSLLNAGVLAVRVARENAALRNLRG